MIVTLWKNLLDPRGDEQEWGPGDLYQKLAKVAPFAGTHEHPGWSPARFDPCERAAENVREVYALCLDYDQGTAIADAVEIWEGMAGFLHTTRSHTNAHPRFRVVLPLSRAVSAFEYAGLWRRVSAIAGAVDPAPKDASRFWYWPGVQDGGEFWSTELEGVRLDPDEWLARPEPVTQTPALDLPRSDPSRIEDRARAYIARMPEAISGSGGHQATWAVALVLAKGFGLSERDTFRLLWQDYNPRCVPPWSEKELRHKARQASQARAPHGFKLDDGREWEPTRWELPPAPEPASDPTPTPPASAAERYGALSISDLYSQLVEELKKPQPPKGLTTGVDQLDDGIGGYRSGNVTIFGAKRGFGKTTYSNLVVMENCREHRIALFACEDAPLMYAKRLLAGDANLNATLLRDFRLQDKGRDWQRITEAMTRADKRPFFVNAIGKPLEWIDQAIKELAAECEAQGDPLRLVVVDYLQKIRCAQPTQDRRNEVTRVAATLTATIKNAGAAGLLFSQLKRSDRLEPTEEDLKESGDLEDMAEHIILGWKVGDEYSGNIDRYVKLAKNKDGPDGGKAIPMRFIERTATFERAPR